ncbi:hypothetical protein GCM10028857_03230 [Salinarchaeum chitinilyticum]
MEHKVKRLRQTSYRDSLSSNEFKETTEYISRVLGDGTVARDIECRLRGMELMARFVVQSFELSTTEERAIARYLEDQRNLLNSLEEEIDTAYTEDLVEK